MSEHIASQSEVHTLTLKFFRRCIVDVRGLTLRRVVLLGKTVL